MSVPVRKTPNTIRDQPSPEVRDLLPCRPSHRTFIQRVQDLQLSKRLENKTLNIERFLAASKIQAHDKGDFSLTQDDEKELASEVLLLRHKFTELTIKDKKFRQAVLTVVQNIYLFQNRKIFFKSDAGSPELERQEALTLFGQSCPPQYLPLKNSFQHLIVARVWHRIISQTQETHCNKDFVDELSAVVEKLNTVRNIYMLLTTGLVKKLATHINSLYKKAVNYEDAVQIGSFGVARASYRYHPSTGVRFSTFASRWVQKEIQRQSLESRLIKISSNVVEKYSVESKLNTGSNVQHYSNLIKNVTEFENIYVDKTVEHSLFSENGPPDPKHQSPLEYIEAKELRTIVLSCLDKLQSDKSADIIRRRFGLPPYESSEQSVISIGNHYGVTRSAIYQIEQKALKELRTLYLSAVR